MTAETVLDGHPDLVERLDQGDVTALVELLEAGGGKVGDVTYEVTTSRSNTIS